MRNAIKKTTAVFALLLGSLPAIFILFFYLQQQRIRHHMKEELEEKLLHTIMVPEEKVQWIEKGRELWIDGKMFDVETYTLDKGVLTLTGLFDEEETALVKQLAEWQDHSQAPGKKILSGLLTLMMTAFRAESELFLYAKPCPQHKQPNHLVRLPYRALVVLTPPPQHNGVQI